MRKSNVLAIGGAGLVLLCTCGLGLQAMVKESNQAGKPAAPTWRVEQTTEAADEPTAPPPQPLMPGPKPTTKAPTAKTPKPPARKPTRAPARKPPPPVVYYKNCAAVRAAGAAPLHRGEPGYRAGLDRDGDGTACE